MDRTVPKTGGEEIQLYMRTYYSLLRSSHAIQIETLVESHMAMDSSLHVHARDFKPDLSAFIYSILRLPDCIAEVEHVLIGQIERSFQVEQGTRIADWERVSAPGRRRRTHFNGVMVSLAGDPVITFPATVARLRICGAPTSQAACAKGKARSISSELLTTSL